MTPKSLASAAAETGRPFAFKAAASCFARAAEEAVTTDLLEITKPARCSWSPRPPALAFMTPRSSFCVLASQ
eukprot:10642279-Lingulodinium_polyedra.AAC.1